MAEIATLTEEHMLELPEPIANRFRSRDRFIVWVEDDTLHLKKIARSITDRVAQAEKSDPPSLDEINDLVHEVRRQRSGKS